MKEIEYKVLGVDDLELLLVELRIKDLKMFSNQKITHSTIENIRVFYKEKMLKDECHTLVCYHLNQIIIHSINGEMIERKTLSQFNKEIQSLDFIQIHKSYIINKRFIQEIKNQEVILKEQTHLPIGRSYKESLKEQN